MMRKACFRAAVCARTSAISIFVLAGLCVMPAGAADQTIRGRVLILKDPRPDDPSRRAVVAMARETGSSSTITGDPTAGGAILEIVANGANPSVQLFPLPVALSWRNENDIFIDENGDPLSDHDPVAVRFAWAVE